MLRGQKLTWSEDRGGDQEAENQTARRGPFRCHIPPPRRPPTKSTPQEGASSPGPRGPLACGSRFRGTATFFSKTHDPPGAVALRRRVCATRNFPPRGTRNSSLPPPHPPSASLAATPKAGDPLIPGDASVVCQGRRGFFFGCGLRGVSLLAKERIRRARRVARRRDRPGPEKGRWGSAAGLDRGSPQVAAEAEAVAAAAGAVAAAAGSGCSEWRTGRRV